MVIFFTVWTLWGSMWTHCGKSMSQSCNFLHSVGTMWIYVNTLWWINATEWQFASQCGHYVALCEHTVVNSIHCCDYVNTVWISLSHSEGANSYMCRHFHTVTTKLCQYYMIHIVSITIQCKGCVHTVVTMWSLCVHIVDYVLTVWTHCGDYVFFPAGLVH